MKLNNNKIIIVLIILILSISSCIIKSEEITQDDEIYFDDGTDEYMFISEVDSPIKLNNITANKIYASAYHSAFINDKNELYHWGLYSNIVSEIPNIIEIKDKKIRDVTLGGNYLVIVTKDENEIYTMGKSNYGVLGNDKDDNNEIEKVPKNIELILPKIEDGNVISISNGYEHSLLVTKNDGIYGWGRNHKYQLGIEKRNELSSEEEYYKKPIKFINENDELFKNYKKLCSGSDHNLLLTKDGQVYSWGNGYFGALGHGNKDNQQRPKKIEFEFDTGYTQNVNGTIDETRVIDIACGGYHSLLLTNTNEIYTFGYAEMGQLGHGQNQTSNLYSPKRIESTGTNYGGPKIASIFAGDHGNSFFITQSGLVYSWGWGESGIGHSTNENIYSPKPILSLSNVQIKEIAAGFKHTLALTNKNEIYVFGDNTYGQLGLKHNDNNNNNNNEEYFEDQQQLFEKQQNLDNFNAIY